MTRRFLASSLSLVLVLLLSLAGATAQDRTGPGPARTPQGEPPTGSEKTTDPLATSPNTTAKEKEKEKEKPKPGTLQEATFGGGCFWCMEAVFQRVPGVQMVVSGYSGGTVPFPTYEMVCTGTTGHAEVVNIVFDASMVSFEKLLEVFWRSHNPNTPNAQGPDHGTQYRSIILYHNNEQKKAVEKVYQELRARRVLHGKVVTQVVPFQAFFPAEAYHQNYYNNHPFAPYSLVYIAPKFDVFRKMTRVARAAAAAKAKSAAAAAKAAAAASSPPSQEGSSEGAPDAPALAPAPEGQASP
jgi:peptide-methionine (S)-S-oxide reductase